MLEYINLMSVFAKFFFLSNVLESYNSIQCIFYFLFCLLSTELCSPLAAEYTPVQLAQGPGRYSASAHAGWEVQSPTCRPAAHNLLHAYLTVQNAFGTTTTVQQCLKTNTWPAGNGQSVQTGVKCKARHHIYDEINSKGYMVV